MLLPVLLLTGISVRTMSLMWISLLTLSCHTSYSPVLLWLLYDALWEFVYSIVPFIKTFCEQAEALPVLLEYFPVWVRHTHTYKWNPLTHTTEILFHHNMWEQFICMSERISVVYVSKLCSLIYMRTFQWGMLQHFTCVWAKHFSLVCVKAFPCVYESVSLVNVSKSFSLVCVSSFHSYV